MEQRENFLLLRNENFRNFFLLFSSASQNLLWLPLQLQFSVAKETEGKRRLGVDGVKARLSIVVFFSRLDCSWFRFCVDFLRYHALFSVLKYYQFEMLISIIGYEGWPFIPWVRWRLPLCRLLLSGLVPYLLFFSRLLGGRISRSSRDYVFIG